MDERKRSEVLAFFWFVVSVLTLLALVSYTPEDIPYEVSMPNSPAHNFVGLVGAYVAWALVLLFGKTAYFLVPIFLFWALAKWFGKKGQRLWLRVFSTVTFFSSACALFSMLSRPWPADRFQAGGMVGFFLSGFLISLFGSAGVFVALSLFLLSLILTTELLILRVAASLLKKGRAWAAPAFLKRREKGLPIPPPKLSEIREKLFKVQKIQPRKEEKEEAIVPQIRLGARVPEQKPDLRITTPPSAETSRGVYRLPSLDLLEAPPPVDRGKLKGDLEAGSRVLEDTLKDFGIEAKVVEVEQGPTITRYELQPAAGVKVQRITSLENDISLAMRATSVRIIAPIPGKSRVGIEVPNGDISTVYIREVLSSAEFQNERSRIGIAIGKDTAGTPLVCNLADMPHLLIAGATNTGKSVCINGILASILFKASPDEVKFLIIDPKMVELHFYNDLPHLICPVITDRAKVSGALAWLVSEMDRRYRFLSKAAAKNILSFNEKVENKEIAPGAPAELEGGGAVPEGTRPPEKMPYIVVVIDELADLIIASQQEVEGAITRLAQLARAVGIHMILATQRPSVDVITGVIKANFPARIAFQVASKVDSRTILDENGADKLLGRGDLLLMDPRKTKLTRAQGAWVQDAEIERLTGFIRSQRKAVYQEAVLQQQEKRQAFGDFRRDEVYDEAKRIVLETGQASVSMVQRRLGLGYTRAARLIDMMEEDGVVGPYRGAKPREILAERPKKGESVDIDRQ